MCGSGDLRSGVFNTIAGNSFSSNRTRGFGPGLGLEGPAWYLTYGCKTHKECTSRITVVDRLPKKNIAACHEDLKDQW